MVSLPPTPLSSSPCPLPFKYTLSLFLVRKLKNNNEIKQNKVKEKQANHNRIKQTKKNQ